MNRFLSPVWSAQAGFASPGRRFQPDSSCGIADLWQFSHRLNLVDEVEHSWNRALHAATEMNFGLHLPRPITWSNLPASTR